MMIAEHIKTGINSVRKARFRSFLTMLGIIIGVVSVVTIVSLGEGLKRQISGQTTELGNNIIMVKPGKLVERDSSGKISKVNLFASTGVASLTQKDLESIRKIPEVTSAVTMGSVSGLPRYNSSVLNDGVIIATSPELTDVIDHKVEFGTFFSSDDTNKKTVVIGSEVAAKLFKETVPIGKSLAIRGESFIVQGIFSPFSEVPVVSNVDLNKAVFIDVSSSKEVLGVSAPIYEILIKKSDDSNSNKLIGNIIDEVTKNHDGQNDFTVLDQSEAGVASDELMSLLTKMIIGMAGVTLFVGGIGIMNVMLVSVSERKREIGIRKSIGATDRQIRNQFLLESAILSVWGAMLGVVIAGILHIAIRIVTNLEPILLWQPIVVAGLVSIVIGMAFGVIPAIKASHKDPIDSFRS
jgi:ABC-type antimicrobial peptide transport system permease subunit